MAWGRLLTLHNTPIIKLAWVLPTIIAVLLIEISRHMGFSIPVPIFIIIVCVIIAGSIGGQSSGFIAGVVATLFLVRAYFEHFGPPALTGSVPQTAIGSMMFILTGTLLGRLRDQRDSNIRALRETEKNLETSLHKEMAKNGRQAAVVAESEARMKTAIRIAGLGHFKFNAITGMCVFCSNEHAAHFGLTPDEFRTTTAGPDPELYYVHSDDRHIVRSAIRLLKSGEAQVFEYRSLHPDGEIRYIHEIVEPVFDASGKVVEEVGTSIDLTELRRAEMRLRQSQRIEALGTLTGGVAHDFNNVLAIILGNLELVLENDRQDDWKNQIQAAIKATLRGADLTKNLLSFSRRAHLVPKRLNLNQLIQNTMAWGARVLPETIVIENSLMAGLWDVELDAASAENALINVLLNARDAMPGGGKVTIETANMRIGDEYVSDRDEDIEPGRYVMLAISDTGHGIPSDKFEKIFEPFYTDKPVGQGSGLGLSMVHGFIKQSGGAIRIYSEVGVGTTFKLYFKATAQTATQPQRQVGEQPNPLREQAAVLVAEDEEDVMHILKRILED